MSVDSPTLPRRRGPGETGETGKTDKKRNQTERSQRPLGLLFVYSWDMLRALFALVGALSVFSGAILVGDNTQVSVPVIAQVIAALAYASFAASLIIIAVVLGRRQRWVRQVQLISLVFAIVLIVASVLAQQITPLALLGNGLFVAIDCAAIAVMALPRVRAWYTEPGAIPTYVSGALIFWAAVGATQVVYVAVSSH